MLMNGGSTAIPQGQIAISNPVVEMLESLLAQAKAGQIGSLAVIAVAAAGGGIATPMVGGQTGDIYIGAAIIQHRLMNLIEPPAGGAPRSPIIRARPVG